METPMMERAMMEKALMNEVLREAKIIRESLDSIASLDELLNTLKQVNEWIDTALETFRKEMPCFSEEVNGIKLEWYNIASGKELWGNLYKKITRLEDAIRMYFIKERLEKAFPELKRIVAIENESKQEKAGRYAQDAAVFLKMAINIING